MVNRLAKTDKQAITRDFGKDDETEAGQRYYQLRLAPSERSKPGKLRPMTTESLDTITPMVNEAKSFLTRQNTK